MSIFKSKFLLGVMIVAVMVVGVAFAMPKTSNAATCDLGTATLRQTMSGSAVTCLQTILNVSPATGYFGTKTKAAVEAFQTTNSLTADGVVGAMTRAALTVSTPAVTPTGTTTGTTCATGAAFDSTTGAACATTALPAGCTSTTGFSTTTGVACSTVTTLPAGCTSLTGFSATTGAACSTTTVATTGAGDLSINTTTADVETQAPEGTETQVLGLKTEATGSDISVSNIKVTLENKDTTGNPSSYRLDHYASNVSVYMGSTKVGSADVSTFTKNGNVYSATIPLSGAVVKMGTANKQTFYVDVTALTNIDSSDATSNTWTVTAAEVRFTDGTGLTLTDNTGYNHPGVNFSKLTTSGDLKLVTTRLSTSPSTQNVEVSDTNSTSDLLMNTFTMKPTGADMTLTSLPIVVAATQAHGALPDMLQSLILKANGVQVGELDLTSASTVGNTTSITLDNDYNMPAGTPVTFAIYAKVNKVSSANLALFKAGDSLTVSIPTAVPVETTVTGASYTSTGSSVGYPQSFFSTGAVVTYINEGFTAETLSSTTGAHISDGIISLTFDVNAFGDNNVTIATDQTGATVGANEVVHTITGATEDVAANSAAISCPALTAVGNVYTISAGDHTSCTLSAKFGTTTGFVKMAVTNLDSSAVSNVTTQNH